jgi:hypothetical protein
MVPQFSNKVRTKQHFLSGRPRFSAASKERNSIADPSGSPATLVTNDVILDAHLLCRIRLKCVLSE